MLLDLVLEKVLYLVVNQTFTAFPHPTVTRDICAFILEMYVESGLKRTESAL